MNHYWRHIPARSTRTGKTYTKSLISKPGRIFRSAVQAHVMEQGRPRLGKARLHITIDAIPPQRSGPVADIDNILKPLRDALQHAGVFTSDAQIDRLTVERYARIGDGRVTVTLHQPS